MRDILFLMGVEMETVVIAALCALAGAFVLSRFTKSQGWISYPLNFLLLFLGAVSASGVLRRLGWPVDYVLERQLLAILGGMALVSVVTILLRPKGSPRR